MQPGICYFFFPFLFFQVVGVERVRAVRGGLCAALRTHCTQTSGSCNATTMHHSHLLPTHTAHARTLTHRQAICNQVIVSFSPLAGRLRSRFTSPCWASRRGAWTARQRWSACSRWPGRSGRGRRPLPPLSAGTDWSGPLCRAAARPWAVGGWGV